MAPTDPSRAADRLLSREDVALRLHVSIRTVSRLVQDRQLHPFKVGKQTRFDPADLESYLERQRAQGMPSSDDE